MSKPRLARVDFEVADGEWREVRLLPEDDTDSLTSVVHTDHLSYGKRFVTRIGYTGDVRLGPVLRYIIDTAEFQRLKFIRQLGLAFYVWPSAQHTRFEHSLGVFDKAFKIIRSINFNQKSLRADIEIPKINEAESIIILMAALLHDISHIPFGHTLEDELGLFARHDDSEFRYKHFFSSQNVQSDLGHLLGRFRAVSNTTKDVDLYKLLRSIISFKDTASNSSDSIPKHQIYELIPDSKEYISSYIHLKTSLKECPPEYRVFMSDIISNTICADLLDYLIRDGGTIGMPLGYDDRLFSHMVLAEGVGDDEGDRLSLYLYSGSNRPPRRDVVTEVLRVLENRYLLNERVYYHKAKASASCMLSMAMYLLNETCRWSYPIALSSPNSKSPESGASVNRDNNFIELEHIIAKNNYGDDQLINELILLATRLIEHYKSTAEVECMSKASSAKYLLKGLLERNLHKQAFHMDTYDVLRAHGNVIDYTTYLRNMTSRRELESVIEREIASFLRKKHIAADVYEGSVLIFCPPLDMNSKRVMARVLLEPSGKACAIEALSEDKVVGRWIESLQLKYEHLWRLNVFIDKSLAREPGVIEFVRRKCELVFHLPRIYFGHGNNPIAQAIDEILEEGERPVDYKRANEVASLEAFQFPKAARPRAGAQIAEQGQRDGEEEIDQQFEVVERIKEYLSGQRDVILLDDMDIDALAVLGSKGELPLEQAAKAPKTSKRVKITRGGRSADSPTTDESTETPSASKDGFALFDGDSVGEDEESQPT
jgi:HD superfamily phosphohydrolase